MKNSCEVKQLQDMFSPADLTVLSQAQETRPETRLPTDEAEGRREGVGEGKREDLGQGRKRKEGEETEKREEG